MKGLILSDPVAVSLMDTTLEKGKSSNIVPAEIKQNGELSARSKLRQEKNLIKCVTLYVINTKKLGTKYLMEQFPLTHIN